MLADHRLYRKLAGRSKKRQKAYRALYDEALDSAFVDALRVATNCGWALGSERFKRRIAEAAGRRVSPLPRGRPRKAKTKTKTRQRARR